MREEKCRNCEFLRIAENIRGKHGWCCNLFNQEPYWKSFTVVELPKLDGQCECYQEAENCLHCEHYIPEMARFCNLDHWLNTMQQPCGDFTFTDKHINEMERRIELESEARCERR